MFVKLCEVEVTSRYIYTAVHFSTPAPAPSHTAGPGLLRSRGSNDLQGSSDVTSQLQTVMKTQHSDNLRIRFLLALSHTLIVSIEENLF